jgi:hypothetical protein
MEAEFGQGDSEEEEEDDDDDDDEDEQPTRAANSLRNFDGRLMQPHSWYGY